MASQNDEITPFPAFASTLTPKYSLDSAHEAITPKGKTKNFITLGALFLSLFLAALDFTIVSPALPAISSHFKSTSGYTWVGSAYLLSNAALTPLWGKTSDIFGRRPVLLSAVFTFFIGSLICAASTSILMLIVGRAIQGGAAGGLVILVNICVSDIFELRERGFWLGMTSVVWALAAGVGPVLGGVFTERLSWRWCWWISLPCSGVAFVILVFYLDVGHSSVEWKEGMRRIDWFGSLAILGATVMFLMGLDFGGVSFPWGSAKVVCLVVFGIVMVAVLFWSEARWARFPVMPLGLFTRRSNVAALFVCFCHGLTYISASYYMPLYFQAVGGASALMSGVLILPIAIMQSCSGIVCGFVIRRTGRYLEPIWIGMTMMTLGFGLFIDLSVHFSLPKIIIFQLIAGLGVGLVFQSPLIALQSLVTPQNIATATATFGFVRNIGCSMSIVLGGVLFQNGMKAHSLAIESVLDHDIASNFSGSGAGANAALVLKLSGEQKDVVRAAYASSLTDMWILYACTAAVGMIASAFIGRQSLVATQRPEINTKRGSTEDLELQSQRQ